MIHVIIPGQKALNLEVLVLDFNGTLSLDGQMLDSVHDNIRTLSSFLEIHIITADTYGTVRQQCAGLPVQIKALETNNHIQEKADYLLQFGSREIVAIGNGTNDQLMLEKAHLGIAVIGFEGASLKALLSADLVVNNIEDGFGVLLETQRLKASLRC